MNTEQTSIDQRDRSPLTFQAGLDDDGQAVIADIARMPHFLIAGPSGTGKSSFVNAMLLSLIEKKKQPAGQANYHRSKGFGFRHLRR